MTWRVGLRKKKRNHPRVKIVYQHITYNEDATPEQGHVLQRAIRRFTRNAFSEHYKKYELNIEDL